MQLVMVCINLVSFRFLILRRMIQTLPFQSNQLADNILLHDLNCAKTAMHFANLLNLMPLIFFLAMLAVPITPILI